MVHSALARQALQPAPRSRLFQSLLSALGGGFGGGAPAPAAPVIHPSQAAAIDFARQRIAAEEYARQREMSIRAFEDPRARSGFEGVSPLSAPMGGGFLPVQNSVVNQFLTNQRLAPAVALGSAAALHGSGQQVGAVPVVQRGMSPMGGSGWFSSGF
jgi:hypothetical protein